MDIFVGNLPFDAGEPDVKALFEGFGNVASVVIVMSKEKKAPKSRGFGFVNMPDEQQAYAAIAALNGREFMGRAINVSPARPKTEAPAEDKLKKVERRPTAEPEIREYPPEERERKRPWAGPVFNKPGTYGGGRRTRSYVKQYGPARIQEEGKSWRKRKENPMRWRKREDQPKPWEKRPGEAKPWEKSKGGPRPWKKPESESRPWKKTGGESKPWKKSSEEFKPWKKPSGEAKPWRKSGDRPQKSGFRSRKKPGGYKR
jgi:hypothetical protein